mmetsp:Transcript_6424/g.13925  ORF Transcript_6424/g.13925 Transcript_6424/m.13925 type:complete len:262 (-) Transcript_6424:144-929(-)
MELLEYSASPTILIGFGDSLREVDARAVKGRPTRTSCLPRTACASQRQVEVCRANRPAVRFRSAVKEPPLVGCWHKRSCVQAAEDGSAALNRARCATSTRAFMQDCSSHQAVSRPECKILISPDIHEPVPFRDWRLVGIEAGGWAIVGAMQCTAPISRPIIGLQMCGIQEELKLRQDVSIIYRDKTSQASLPVGRATRQQHVLHCPMSHIRAMGSCSMPAGANTRLPLNRPKICTGTGPYRATGLRSRFCVQTDGKLQAQA